MESGFKKLANTVKFATAVFLVMSCAGWAQSVYFVKYDASGAGDGSSWIDAYTSLQTALTACSTGDRIWVAKGTYQPSEEVGGSGNRYKAFQMKAGVGIFGGFAGNEEYAVFNLADRDFDSNETILSGDLGDGVNVYHVFSHINLGLTTSAVLDGFTVSGGKADGTGNDGNGGGMLNQGSSPTIRNCNFENNTALQGGAIYNSRYSSPTILDTVFISNTAVNKGGAVYNTRNTPTFTSCSFVANETTNTSSNDGGGAIYNNTSSSTEGPTIIDCFFEENKVSSISKGGAINSYLNPGKLIIIDSMFMKNQGQYGGAIYLNSGSDIDRDNSDIQFNGSIFQENQADYGGAVFSDRHNTIVTSCIISGNEASEQAGGFYSRYASSKLINSLISGNRSAKHGGGAYFNFDSPEMINTTVSGNYSSERGGGISIIGDAVLTLKNTILWGNNSPEGKELWVCNTCEADIDYSIYSNSQDDVFITSGGLVNASNSITDNPEFVDAIAPNSNTAPNIAGDYSVLLGSAAIDAGLNSHTPLAITNDLAANSRIIDGNQDSTNTVDIGAYELNPTDYVPAGSGTAQSPYQIETLYNLYWITLDGSRLSKYYIQTEDIDASVVVSWDNGKGWTPIGGNGTALKFSGSYNGNGRIISNLYINRPDAANVGFFGHLDSAAVIENLGLIDAEVIGGRGTGSLVGRVTGDNNTYVRRCYSRAGVNNKAIVVGDGATGGLVGSNNSYVTNPSNRDNHPTIEYCWADVDVEWSKNGNGDKIGGLAGCNQKGRIYNSYATGSITVDNSGGQTNPEPERVGGLAGCVLIRGYVEDSYSVGKVTAIGTVNYVGGIIGRGGTGGSDGDTFDCFWDTETSGRSTSSPTSGCTGKTTAQMKTEGTFTNAGWDFTDTWYMETDGYPRLIDVGDGRGIEIAGLYVYAVRARGEFLFEYDVEVKIRNTGEAISNAAVTLVGVPNNISVIYGTVTVGEMAQNTEIFSTDLLTIEINRSVYTDTDKITWFATKREKELEIETTQFIVSTLAFSIKSAETITIEDIIPMAEKWLSEDGGHYDRNNDGIVNYLDFSILNLAN